MTQKTIVNKPYKFITHDFKGEAEVLILKGRATISKIIEQDGTAQVLFDVITSANAKAAMSRPEKAWFSLSNTQLTDYIKAAYASGKEVTYRIEIQRKKKIAKEIPFMDLYQTMEAAQENTVRILALIDDVESNEAVTLPSDDPVFDKPSESATISELEARRAAANKAAEPAPTPPPAPEKQSAERAQVGIDLTVALNQMVRSGDFPVNIVDTVAALAIAQGTPVNSVNAILYNEGKQAKNKKNASPPRTFSTEAPRWEEYNSDGRLNLGSSLIASSISIESAVSRNILSHLDPKPNPSELENYGQIVHYFSQLAYTICDYSQVRAYGEGFRVDRKAESHTRIRGIFIDLLERFFSFPVEVKDGALYIQSSQDVDAWMKNIGTQILTRFNSAIENAQTFKSFAQLRSELGSLPLLTPVAAQPHVQAPVAPEPQVEAPVAAQEQVRAPQPQAPVTVQEPSARSNAASDLIKNYQPTGEYSPAAIEEEMTAAAASGGGMFAAEEEISTPRVMVTDQVIKLPAEGYEGELATTEQVERFKQLLDSLGFNLENDEEKRTIGKIIRFTFGNQFAKLQEIPGDLLEEFIDWYVAVGSDAINELRNLVAAEY